MSASWCGTKHWDERYQSDTPNERFLSGEAQGQFGGFEQTSKISVYAHTHTHIYIYIYIPICTARRVCVCVSLHMCVCLCACHVMSYVYVYAYAYVYVYVKECVHVRIRSVLHVLFEFAYVL